ncbi:MULTISPECIES: FxSxx-COOH cyclophane-containing RiPP peptide [unclassified Streptomyces]|uniref:FxSxx-COOH cyclophane-containing RiPP peptide n=1 Tax=unclassified Streptomyces TaxID=2593676 RepID=UPI00344ECAF4
MNSAPFAAAKKDRVSLAELAAKGMDSKADKSLSRVLPICGDGRPAAAATFNSAL